MIEHLFNYETGEKEEAHMQRSWKYSSVPFLRKHRKGRWWNVIEFDMGWHSISTSVVLLIEHHECIEWSFQKGYLKEDDSLKEGGRNTYAMKRLPKDIIFTRLWHSLEIVIKTSGIVPDSQTTPVHMLLIFKSVEFSDDSDRTIHLSSCCICWHCPVGSIEGWSNIGSYFFQQYKQL